MCAEGSNPEGRTRKDWIQIAGRQDERAGMDDLTYSTP